jgi:hypothetical protein
MISIRHFVAADEDQNDGNKYLPLLYEHVDPTQKEQ